MTRTADVTEVIGLRRTDAVDMIRVLLLLQGSILVATTIESLFWTFAFPGAGGASLVLTAACASVVLVARSRSHPERGWSRRLLFIVESGLIFSIAIDAALALLITHGVPPAAALLTRLVLPVVVIAVLRRTEGEG